MAVLTTINEKIRFLKGLIILYIILAITFASLNYALAPNVSPELGHLITSILHFYENGFKVALIIVASLLTISILRTQKTSAMRKNNLIALSISALVLHIFLPFVLHNQELYFFSMPLPWSTMPLQLLDKGSAYYNQSLVSIGKVGFIYSLIFSLVLTIVIVIGTLIKGRRWQCSSLCMFNGFAGEIFSVASPIKKSKNKGRFLKRGRWIYLTVALLFMFYWVALILSVVSKEHSVAIASLEVAKYLIFELFFMMFCWVLISPRGYCYVCPVGTTLSLLSKVINQRIVTNETRCISCNKCNDVCPMGIDIASKAKIGEAVIDSLCVGCGHCVDICPKQTLRYTTDVLEKIHLKKS